MGIIGAIKSGTRVSCCCGEHLVENKISIISYKYSAHVGTALH